MTGRRRTSSFNRIGTHRAELEAARDDGAALGSLQHAEDEHGFRTGLRLSDDGFKLVTARFYPDIRFYICRANALGEPMSDSEELSREAYDGTWSLLEGRPDPSPC